MLGVYKYCSRVEKWASIEVVNIYDNCVISLTLSDAQMKVFINHHSESI